MDPKLDEKYMTWLYSKVEIPGEESYWALMEQLYRTEFVWRVYNDDSRAADGRGLRREFMFHHRMRELPEEWEDLECSMLEMLIGVANRMAFQLDLEVEDCFWHILENLGLDGSSDDDPMSSDEIDDILARVNDRTYDYAGAGGLFPLKNPNRDQREVEILYQLYSYIQENHY